MRRFTRERYPHTCNQATRIRLGEERGLATKRREEAQEVGRVTPCAPSKQSAQPRNAQRSDAPYHVTYLPVDRDGLLKLADLENAITDEAAVVSDRPSRHNKRVPWRNWKAVPNYNEEIVTRKHVLRSNDAKLRNRHGSYELTVNFFSRCHVKYVGSGQHLGSPGRNNRWPSKSASLWPGTPSSANRSRLTMTR